MASLVLLLPTPVSLSADDLRQRLSRLYPGHFQGSGGPDDSFVIPTERPEIQMVKSLVPGAGGIFLSHAVPKPYTGFSGFLGKINDPALRSRASDSRAWLSVDLVSPITTIGDAYHLIGQVLADVAPSQTVAVVHPETESTTPFAGPTREALRQAEVLAALGFAPSSPGTH